MQPKPIKIAMPHPVFSHKALLSFCLLLSLAAASTHAQTLPSLEQMTVREKVGQVFNVRCEDLLTNRHYVIMPEQEIIDNFRQYPVGFFSLFAANIVDSVQLKTLTSFLHALTCYPLLCIDEEGGRVARIGRNEAFDVPTYPNGMRAIGDSGRFEEAYMAGRNIGSYLYRFGLDINYAPVADACLEPDSSFMGTRLFGGDAYLVAGMDSAVMMGLREEGVVACYKHFPGHGNTHDTHKGSAVLERSKEEMGNYELVPFRMGVKAGMEMVMVAHICAYGDSLPATLSPYVMDTVLRQELSFEGLIITDGLEMRAITERYSTGEAAIRAFLAGADILMLPQHYFEAYDAMVEAVENGRIPIERLDASVSRILALKKKIIQMHPSEAYLPHLE